MPKKFLRRFLPDAHSIRQSKQLQMFGKLLNNPNLWHLNRRSVATAVAIGLFFMWVPIPFHTLMAAGVAIVLEVNLPISMVVVWIANPLTMGPMFYFAYVVGTWITGSSPGNFHFEHNFAWLQNELALIWKPFLIGCLTMSITNALAGFAIVRMLWRRHILRHLAKRREKKVLHS